MNKEPTEPYIYQPFPPKPDGNYFGVAVPLSWGLELGNETIRGIDKQSAEEIVRICKKEPEFAKNFFIGIKSVFTNKHTSKP